MSKIGVKNGVNGSKTEKTGGCKMDKFIFKMEVTETIMPDKRNWLEYMGEPDFKDEDYKEKKYELFFATFEEMSKKIDEITVGCHQFWANIYKDSNNNDIENLEYHNGYGEWDKEIYIDTSRLYLTDSFWEALNKYKSIRDKGE